MAVKPPKPTPGDPGTAEPPTSSAGPAEVGSPPTTTPARLRHDANYHRAAHDRRLSLDGGPEVGRMLDGAPGAGRSIAELMPSSVAHGHPDLPEADKRPPPFLSPLAAMKDIYLKVKGRASPRTTELLDGPDLEALLAQLKDLFSDDARMARVEARLAPPLWSELTEDPGPLLLGLHDPRLTELWRLFLDGWDIWRPEGDDAEGVELFWEGEADNDQGHTIEIVQSLTYLRGDIVLHTRLGDLEDHLTFDGQSFYRLRPR